jgi:hypothetical protein
MPKITYTLGVTVGEGVATYAITRSEFTLNVLWAHTSCEENGVEVSETQVPVAWSAGDALVGTAAAEVQGDTATVALTYTPWKGVKGAKLTETFTP